MDPNSLQQLPGTMYINKLQSAQPSDEPFAAYDVLTPDDPAPIVAHIGQLISNLGSVVAALKRNAATSRDGGSVTLDRISSAQ